MRRIAIPARPDSSLFVAPGYTADALAARERFLRSAAEAWSRAGDARTAASLSQAADVQRARHGSARA